MLTCQYPEARFNVEKYFNLASTSKESSTRGNGNIQFSHCIQLPVVYTELRCPILLCDQNNRASLWTLGGLIDTLLQHLCGHVIQFSMQGKWGSTSLLILYVTWKTWNAESTDVPHLQIYV